MSRLAAVLGAFAVVAAVGSAPADANPGPGGPPHSAGKHHHARLDHRIRSLNAQLDRLSRRNAQLDEQYNQAAATVRSARRTARGAQQAADDAEAGYLAAHARFVAAVTQQYEGGSSPSVGSLLTSGEPQQYLDSLTMDSYLAGHFADTVRAERQLRADAAVATRRAVAALAVARGEEVVLANRRTDVERQAQRFQQLVDTLTARQRREIAREQAAAAAEAAALAPQRHKQRTAASPGSHPPRVLAGPASDAVQRVIAFAEAQVGKPYSYAGSGPYAYDCSGLTMASYAQIGIHLPHSAAEQYNYGTHVAYSQLQPGDLIFLYSPIGHVELYVGHDLAVSAANPATGIVYVHPSRDMGNYIGATRLTG